MSVEELETKSELIQQLVHLQAEYITELHRIVLQQNNRYDEINDIIKNIQNRFEEEV